MARNQGGFSTRATTRGEIGVEWVGDTTINVVVCFQRLESDINTYSRFTEQDIMNVRVETVDSVF